MICIVGTAHIIRVEEEVRRILSGRPAWAVGIELDEGRLYSLLYRKGSAPKGIVGKTLHYLEKVLANLAGSEIGSDMVGVYKVASELGRPIYMIDMPINQTMKRLNGIPLKEKLSLITLSALGGLLAKATGELEEKDLENMLEEFRRKFPRTYRILIEERNEYMAERIKEIEERHGNIVAFVGMGHLKGLSKLIPDAEVINLVKSLSF